MTKKRVVVTGMGVVSPIGTTIDDFWNAAINGISGIKSIDRFEIPSSVSKVAGLIENYQPLSADVYNNYNGDDRTIHFALDAFQQAEKQARLDVKLLQASGSICSVVLSSAVAAICSMERYFNQATKSGTQPYACANKQIQTPYFEFNYINDVLAKNIGINGRSLLLPTGCAGCLDAIAYAVSTIRNGLSDVVITGASEAPISPLVVAAFNKVGATSIAFNDIPSRASRPFDRDRDGFVLGEGCGILILESLEHAKRRGAPIIAEITGVASVNNCFHMTNIPEDGISIASACQLALNDAGLTAEKIDHVNAHGSSTPQNDVAETNAFAQIFGKNYKHIPVTSNKSFLGHALAASNALETILSIQTINHHIIPPTINLDHQDERCDLNVVANFAKKHAVTRVLKNSSGFSGIHSAIVIEAYSGESHA